jgi:hypothetical protein
MPSSILNSDDGVISGTSGLKSSGGDDGVLVFQSKGTETARINTDKQIVAAAGTASLPVITTTGDLNTGIFFPAADTIAFAEGGAEAMRIDSDGDVGIGTTSPSAKLHLVGTTGIRIDGGAGNTAVLELRSGTTPSDGSSISATYNGSGSYGPLKFSTSDTERARITSGGNLLVGTTSSIAGGGGSHISVESGTEASLRLRRSTDGGVAVFYRSSDSAVGSISVTASATAYNTSSDYRLKENIASMTGALATVAQLNPVTYTWKSTGEASQGFIAHELQAVVPDCVTGEKDAVDADGNPQYQGIDTSFLVATLTAAIQELSAKNDALEARIAALEQA